MNWGYKDPIINWVKKTIIQYAIIRLKYKTFPNKSFYKLLNANIVTVRGVTVLSVIGSVFIIKYVKVNHLIIFRAFFACVD